ncbi:MAG: DUF393 domain-containing protein [Planctomycetota bacterium]|nr:DUF393 domain-containing protein [Planctomycetota bacterium]
MRKLTVLYDAQCAVCRYCRDWLLRQPKFLELEFLAARSEAALTRYPGLKHGEELVAVSDEGGVYRGDRAWIMCLYALVDFREWSLRLAAPALRPFARRAFKALSEHRYRVSRVLLRDEREDLAALLRSPAEPSACSSGVCGDVRWLR